MSNVLFIAGGLWQKPFVSYLKGKGHRVLVVNPVVTETTKLASDHIQQDVRNVAEIIAHVDEILHRPPCFVTSDQSDISTMIVSVLSDHWNLPGNPPDVIDKFTDKYSIYSFGRAIRVNVPPTDLVVSTDDIKTFAQEFGYPVIIKPVDSTMSRGFRKFDGAEEVTEEALESTLMFSKTKRVITQAFMPGDMVTLEGCCSGGRHRTLASSRKTRYFKAGITMGVKYPSELDPEFLDKIIEANDKYVEKSGLRFGLTHSEFIINGEDFCLLEIGARGGGAGITDKIVPWVSGIDVYEILHDSLMGKVVDVKSLRLQERHALLEYYEKEDLINFKDYTEEIMAIPGVAEYRHNFLGKQYVSDPNDTRYSMGIYLAEDQKGIEQITGEITDVICRPE